MSWLAIRIMTMCLMPLCFVSKQVRASLDPQMWLRLLEALAWQSRRSVKRTVMKTSRVERVWSVESHLGMDGFILTV